jgi:hypothetical protein
MSDSGFDTPELRQLWQQQLLDQLDAARAASVSAVPA